MRNKKNILENLLCFFLIIAPILDMTSFLFRGKYNTNFSISTFIRPIIPGIAFIIIFLKQNMQKRLLSITVFFIYLLYGIIHLYIYKNIRTTCSYGTFFNEAQYIINYSFMILNLFIYYNIFKENNSKKLVNSILISLSIYIISIYISIVTNTSSTTYIEGIGYKGWFESGNSISAILLISLFIILSYLTSFESKKIKIYTFIIIIAVGIFLVTLIGTRVGLLGFILAILCFIISEMFYKIINKKGMDKKTLFIFITVLTLLIIIVAISGSLTIQRRTYLKSLEGTIINEVSGDVSNVTGDLTVIRNEILNNNLIEGFMTNEQQKSILDLYDIAKKYDISNTNRRMQQFIYHIMLIKNQSNFVLILFGNGYLINTNELVLEMEIPALLFNFGIIGFTLYMIPFFGSLFYNLVRFMKVIKRLNSRVLMLFFTVILIFIISTLAGYTFFNSSSMMIIVVANILLKNEVDKLYKIEIIDK